MADASKYLQTQKYNLAGAGCVLGATSITLSSMLQIDGTTEVTMTDFGTKGFATIEPGNGTREEQISFTGITQNPNGTATLTGVSNVIFASPYTETSGTEQSHPGGVVLVISNTSGFYNRVATKDNDETITGLWTFPANDTSAARIASDVDTSIATAFVTLGQLSRQAISGASNASTAVKGIVQLPTQAQVDAKTTTGSTSALLALTPDKQRSTLLSDYVADTGSINTFAITPSPAISAYAAGQRFSLKAANANTAAATLNVNGAGAKTIKRPNGSDIAAGDIISGQLFEVEYDGTNFQMLSPIASTTPIGIISPYAGFIAPSGWLLCDGSAVSRTTYSGLFNLIDPSLGTCTVSVNTPAVVSLTAHGLVAGDAIYFTTTGALPTGMTGNTIYYVISAGLTADQFEFSATRGGSAINTSGSQSGIQTLFRTPYGLGDGATTFNVPDLRTNVPVGRKSSDSHFSNVGLTGGEETHLLITAEIPAHTHSVSIPTTTTGSGVDSLTSTNGSTPHVYTSGSTGGDGAHNNLQPYLTVQYIIKT